MAGDSLTDIIIVDVASVGIQGPPGPPGPQGPQGPQGFPGSGGTFVLNTQTVATVTGNAITVPAGTNYIIVQDSAHAVNSLTVGSGSLADGYDLWMNFPNGGMFAGISVAPHGNLTLKVLGGGWTILAKYG